MDLLSASDMPWRGVMTRWAQVFQEERGLVNTQSPNGLTWHGDKRAVLSVHTRVYMHVPTYVWMKTRKCVSSVGCRCEGHKSNYGQWIKNVADLIFWWLPYYGKNLKILIILRPLTWPPAHVDTNVPGSHLRSRLQFAFSKGLISQFLRDQYFPACVFFRGLMLRERSGWLFSGKNGIC